MAGPDDFINTNIIGLIFAQIRIRWLEEGISNHLFHHISTDEVFGSLVPAEPPFGEKSRPNSPYSASKAASDHLVDLTTIRPG